MSTEIEINFTAQFNHDITSDLMYSYERDCGDYKEHSHEVVIDWYKRLKGLSEKEIIEILSKISDDLDRAYEYGEESYG